MTNGESIQTEEAPERNTLGGFLEFARGSGVRISTAEWLDYLNIIETVGKEGGVLTGDLYDTLKSFGAITLVKDKADLPVFSEAFDEYFKDIKAARDEKEKSVYDIEKEIGKKAFEALQIDEEVAEKESDIKEQLGVKEVTPNDLGDAEHEDNETVHGGQKDQHNDVLQKADKTKDGGGNLGKNTLAGDGNEKGDADGKGVGNRTSEGGNGDGHDKTNEAGHAKEATGNHYTEKGIGHSFDGEQKERTELGIIGNMGGKGKYDDIAEARAPKNIIHTSSARRRELSEEVRSKDRRERYNVRPNRTEISEIVKNLRRIIMDTSEAASNRLDIDATVEHFAKQEFKFSYESEREARPETVLFIDVGGPVDEWRPLMEELSEGMSRGLLKLEIYLFHNQLYGYCWDPKDGNFARPNGLKNVQDIVKKRKKVIIYGDADMAASEVDYDNYPPSQNERKVERYRMNGIDCLKYIKEHSDKTVWINPIFKSSWYYDEYYDEYNTNNSIGRISDVIPMYDLSIGGVQDAVADLMKK